MSVWERVIDNLRTRPSGVLGTREQATRERLPQVPLGVRLGTASVNAMQQAGASSSAFNPFTGHSDDLGLLEAVRRFEGFGHTPQNVSGAFDPFTGHPDDLGILEAARRFESRNTGGGGDVTTNPGDPSQFQPDPYPTVLPSLSAAQLGQLAERRRLADERLKQAEAEKERRKGLLEASSVRAREEADRISKRSLQDFMRQAGGKGLARSPMVAGRQVRREGEDLRLKYGEIDTRLSTEVAALQDMVSRAASERDIAIAQIEQERVNMQADLDRLFPAAGMFR